MTLLLPSRRGFLAGLAALCATPAIVRAASLMPLRGSVLLPSPLQLYNEGDATLTTALTAHESLNYTYWVSEFGFICRMTGREILAAPPGTIQPWLPQSGEFRPTNEHEKGLVFEGRGEGDFRLHAAVPELRVRNLANTLDTDPVIVRLREEQQELLRKVAATGRGFRGTSLPLARPSVEVDWKGTLDDTGK